MYTLKTFIKSDAWQDFRGIEINKRISKNERGELICEHCGKVIANRYDTIVHHITELTEQNVNDFMVSLNPDNVMIVHFKCHNQIHRRFGFESFKKVYIVYGAPCSGKTTWVHNNAGPTDLIVDMDSIHQMISVNERYIKNNRLDSVAFGIRDSLYDVIKYRNGKWQDAYVIVGAPYKMERERLVTRLGATEQIYINTSKAECYRRLMQRNITANVVKDWQGYIDDWFNRHQE